MTLLNWNTLTLDPTEIRRLTGALPGALPSSLTDEDRELLIAQCRKNAVKLLSPRVIYARFPVKLKDGRTILLNERIPFRCNAKFFAGASEAVILLGTIGPRLEQEAARAFMAKRFPAGVILDACGTVALDELLELARQEINRELAPGKNKLGYTLSPGCQLIPVEEQVIIFSLLDFEKIEVGLTDEYQMQPGKSISAIIPAGRDLRLPSSVNYACEVCNLQAACTYRR